MHYRDNLPWYAIQFTNVAKATSLRSPEALDTETIKQIDMIYAFSLAYGYCSDLIGMAKEYIE